MEIAVLIQMGEIYFKPSSIKKIDWYENTAEIKLRNHLIMVPEEELFGLVRTLSTLRPDLLPVSVRPPIGAESLALN